MTTGRIPPVEGGIQPTIFDAKADLLTATAADVPARLAVGSNGDTLVADSTTTTGLRWQADWNTGKNKIINGDFRINQRAFSSTTTNDVYGHDRWASVIVNGGGTVTYSTQAFTPGAAPVAGYEAINFARIVTASQANTDSWAALKQKIEDVRTFAGQTVTVSFWAKAGSGTPNIVCYFQQDFGTGGSPSTTVNVSAPSGSKKAISTSWARYSFTFDIPSISGKTIGTNVNTSFLMLIITVSRGSDGNAQNDSIGIQNGTFDIWGVQVEAGSVATPFTTATGTIQGELAACQRYYWRTGGDAAYQYLEAGFANSTTAGWFPMRSPQTFRVAPTAVDYSTLAIYNGGSVISATNVTIQTAGKDVSNIAVTVSGATSGSSYYLITNNSTSGYLGLSAEL